MPECWSGSAVFSGVAGCIQGIAGYIPASRGLCGYAGVYVYLSVCMDGWMDGWMYACMNVRRV